MDKTLLAPFKQRLDLTEVVRMDRIYGSRSNRIYKITLKNQEPLILKHYYHQDNLNREFEGLRYLLSKGITGIPTAYHYAAKERLGIYSFLEGDHLNFKNEKIQGVSKEFLDQVVEFLMSLHSIRPDSDNEHFGAAIGAASGIGKYADMILLKSEQSWEATPKSTQSLIGSGVKAFLRKEVIRTVEGNDSLLNDLKGQDLRLSPVDFGSHNILIDRGTLNFIDFEEFGWDDPMQIVAYMAPALKPNDEAYFLNSYLQKSPLPTRITTRLPLVLRLRHLDWITRLLAGTTNEVVKKRSFAGGEEFSREAYLQKQASRIRLHLDNYNELYGRA